MNISDLKESKFLKRSDVGEGTVVTITGVNQQNVAKEGAPEEMKWVLHVQEFDKGMVLNSTNGQLIAQALKSDESDDWTGKQVVLYDDPSVSFGGKLVGGIRVRAVSRSQQSTGSRVAPGTYRPAGGGTSAKGELKAKFKAHPGFGTDFKAEDVNAYFTKNYGMKLDDLSEDDAKAALGDFDNILETISVPF